MIEPCMTTIGFIGSGLIGSAVARQAIEAGYDVVMSNSRGPETLADLVADLGEHASAATKEEAAERADLAVLTVPLHAYEQAPAAQLAGKTVIDTCNYYPERDGHIAALDDESTTTSELVQAHLADSRVVKAFGNINDQHIPQLARPVGAEDRTALAIAGDDEAAKETVTRFLDAIGFDAVDAGPLAEGWRWQRDTEAYGQVYTADNDGDYAKPGVPRDAAYVADKLRQSKRYRDM